MTIHGIKQLCSASRNLAPKGFAPRYQLQVNLDLETGKLYWADIVGHGQIQYNDPHLIYVGKISHPVTMAEIREMIDRALEWRGITGEATGE